METIVASPFWEVTFSDVVNGLIAVVALIAAIVSLKVAENAGRNDVLSQVREWGSAVVDRTAALIGLCYLDPQRFGAQEFFARRADLVSELSSLWDQGRFFFPNTYRRHYGTTKEEAFRGIRPPILDILALCHGLALSVDYDTGQGNDRRRLAATRLKRVFVSAIQRKRPAITSC